MTRIPLFPLNVVLLPGAALPLHIFEPRYKLMITRCLERREEFGMILLRDRELASVGCTARILQLLKRYDDGRMDILTAGHKIFQLTRLRDEKAYYEGEVEFVEDEARRLSEEARKKLNAAYEQCFVIVHGQEPPNLVLNEGASMAYQVAALLPLDLEAKQTLLEMRNEEERALRLSEELERWAPKLEELLKLKNTAGTNGHGVN